MEKLLTIAVPTYNVEKYLGKCLDSLCIPNFREVLEVLVINDGSTDNSQKIALEYEKKEPDIFRVITKANGGHGSTINEGIRQASGKYFKVIDSDDWVENTDFLKFMEYLSHSRSDVVYTNFYHVDHKTGKKRVEFPVPFSQVEYQKEYEFQEIKEDFFLKMHGFTIRTEILRKIPQITEHCFYVDMEYVLFPIPYIKTIVFLDLFVYQYRIGLPGQSMSPERMKRNGDNYDWVLDRLLSYYQEWMKKGLNPQKQSYLEHVLGRMVSSRIKIYLSQECKRENKKQLIDFEEGIRSNYPKVYDAVKNPWVLGLRKSRYYLYGLASLLLHLRSH